MPGGVHTQTLASPQTNERESASHRDVRTPIYDDHTDRRSNLHLLARRADGQLRTQTYAAAVLVVVVVVAHLQAVERQQVGLVHEEHCLRGVSDTFLDFLSPRHRAPRLSRDNINEQRTVSFDQKRLDE